MSAEEQAMSDRLTRLEFAFGFVKAQPTEVEVEKLREEVKRAEQAMLKYSEDMTALIAQKESHITEVMAMNVRLTATNLDLGRQVEVLQGQVTLHQVARAQIMEGINLFVENMAEQGLFHLTTTTDQPPTEDIPF